MSLVLTNWKAAFWRERGTSFLTGFAVFIFVFEFIAPPRHSPDPRIIGVSGLFLLMGPVLSVLRMQRAMVAAPMLFCLPRHRESLRALTFSGALLAGLAWALAFGLSPIAPTPPADGMSLASGFLTGVVLYLALTTPRLILSRRAFIWVRRAAIALVILALEVFPEPRDDPFVAWPVLMPVLVALAVFVWIRLGNMERVRRGQRIILEDAMERGPGRKSPGTTLPWVEEWLQSRMERQSYLHAGRYVWGQLYVTVGRLLHYWKWVLGILIGITWLLGYMGQFAANTLFVASGSLVWMQRWPVTFPLLLPGGRRERCRATISAVVAMSLLLMAAALAVVVLSWLLTLFLGGPPPEGSEVTYKALQARSVFLACLLVPWFAALGLLGFRVRSLGELVMIVLVVVPLSASLFALMREMRPDWAQRIVTASVFVVPGVFVGGWLFLLLVLWTASRRWDLVSQRLMSEN
jgi:hypothetical protein